MQWLCIDLEKARAVPSSSVMYIPLAYTIMGRGALTEGLICTRLSILVTRMDHLHATNMESVTSRSQPQFPLLPP